MKNNLGSGGRPERGEERATHRSLERGLHIIESVVATPGGASLAETARRIGLHRSTTHHLLQALVGMGYLGQDPRTRRYHPTIRLSRLAAPASGPDGLEEIAHPFLAELARRSEEEACLTLYRDGIAVAVATQAPGASQQKPADDGIIALHATAPGKVLLAWQPEAERTALLNRLALERFTTSTIDNRAVLETELQRIRAAGVAIDDEESRDGMRGIAAPVFDRTGLGVAALGVHGPKARMTRQKIKDLRDRLGELAGQLSERLGWRPDSSN